MAITAKCVKEGCNLLLFDTESLDTLTNKKITCAGCGTVYEVKTKNHGKGRIGLELYKGAQKVANVESYG